MRISLLIIFFSLTAIICSTAQYTSLGGNFTVNEIKGCANSSFSVIVSAVICDGSPGCDVSYTGANADFQTFQHGVTNFSHTYSTAGTRYLKLVIGTIVDSIQIISYADIKPAFQLYTCTGNKVSLKISDTSYNSYFIIYTDEAFTKAVPSGSLAQDIYTYGSPGLKTIKVRGRKTGALDNCSDSTQTINVSPALPPATINTLTAEDADNITLDYSILPTNKTLYKLEIATNNGTTFQTFKDVYRSTSETFASVRPDDNYYCFRLIPFDQCANAKITALTSPLICSANFDVTPQNEVNKLVWSTLTTGMSGFVIQKNDEDGVLPSINRPTSPLFYDDTDVTCNIEYSYRLISTYPSGSQSISMFKSATAFSNTTPTAVQNISSVVGQNSVALDWDQDPAFTANGYTVYKTVGGQTGLMTTTPTPTATDPLYDTNVPMCYKVQYRDACNNLSPMSLDACPVQLTGVLQADNSIVLQWSAYTGWTNGVDHYVVEKFDEQGNLNQTFTLGNVTTLTDNDQDPEQQVFAYVVHAIPNDAVNLSVSNTIIIIKEPHLFYPMAFTPNGDKLNDTFKVFGQYVTAFEMNIFNRWGEMLFSTTDINQPWDGTYKGNDMPEGTYAFTATITDLAGRTFDRSGSIVLLRKK